MVHLIRIARLSLAVDGEENTITYYYYITRGRVSAIYNMQNTRS